MSEIRADTFSDASGGQPTVTGGLPVSVSVRYDQAAPTTQNLINITSVTDNSTGNFTVNLISPMAITAWAFTYMSTANEASLKAEGTTSRRLETSTSAGSGVDATGAGNGVGELA